MIWLQWFTKDQSFLVPSLSFYYMKWLLSKGMRDPKFLSLNTQANQRPSGSYPEFPAKVSFCLLLQTGDLAISGSILGTRGMRLGISFAQFLMSCPCPVQAHRPKMGKKWLCKRKQELLEFQKPHVGVVKTL